MANGTTGSATGLAAADLFRPLDAGDLAQLESRLTRRHYRRGDVVCHQHDPGGRLYVIEQGRLKVALERDTGEEILVGIFGPGSVIGELSIITEEPRTATVVAVEPAVVASLDRATFYSLLENNPRIAIGCLEMLARRIRASDELLQDMTFLDVPGRLAKRLLDLSEECGRDVDGGRLIDIRLTQDELATMIGTTRESINKTLSTYERQGLLARQGGRLVIRDRERLQRRIY